MIIFNELAQVEGCDQVEIIAVTTPNNPDAFDHLLRLTALEPRTAQSYFVSVADQPAEKFLKVNLGSTSVWVLEIIPI